MQAAGYRAQLPTTSPEPADARDETASLRRRVVLSAVLSPPVLLTGDNETTAKAVAVDVGIDEVIAEVLPGARPAS